MPPSWQITEFVNFLDTLAAGNYYYSQGAGRCDPLSSGYADCSGAVVAAARHVGVTIDCTGSFAISRMCHAAGTGIGTDEARNTRGALLFLGENEGQGGIPGVDPGHIATSSGDGTIVEARNHNAGILITPYDFFGGWAYHALPPWFPATSDTPPSPMPPPEVAKMFVAIEATASGKGYVCVKDDGAVFAYGDAQYHGGANPPAVAKLDAPITDIALLPNNKGYWLIAGDGGIFAFGQAKFMGRPT